MTSTINHAQDSYLLIDDDPLYRALVEATAEQMGVELKSYPSIAEMGSCARIKDYAAVLLDYELEHLNGLEIAEYIDTFFKDIPVVLVTGHAVEQFDNEKWPLCIREITSKQRPIAEIIDSVVGFRNRQQYLARLSNRAPQSLG